MVGEISEIGSEPKIEQGGGEGIGGEKSGAGGQITRSTAIQRN